MKYLIVLIVLFLSLLISAQPFSKYARVKIQADSEELIRLMELGIGIDHGIHGGDEFFISDFSERDIQIMELNGVHYEVLIPDVQDHYAKQNNELSNEKNTDCYGISQNTDVPEGFNLGSMGGYLNYDELLAELDDMQAQFPGLISVRQPISTYLTHENRPVYYIVISDNPGTLEQESNVLYTALHHAREPMGLSSLVYYMWYLLENYSTNDEVKYLVDNNQLFFVPCVNPDGYVYNWTTNPNGGGMHRKNRRDVGTSNKGVDLNRNYSYQWGQQGVSFDPDSDIYCGTGPFSEPETQAIKWLVETFGFTSALNAHTFGDLHLFPIGADAAEFADHHDYFVDLAGHMVEYNGFTAQKATSLYPVSGGSDDYMYRENIGEGMKDTIFAMVPEIGPSFWPPASLIVPTCQQMLHPNMVLAHIPHKYYVTKDLDPYIVTSLSGVFTHSVQRLGREDGQVTVSVEPLQNLQNVGISVAYDLALRAQSEGNITYELNPSVQSGDEIRYVLHTDYGIWVDHDTITKVFTSSPLQVNENASNNVNWSGSWSTTNSAFVSSSSSFTDSPSGNYQNNANTTYTFDQVVDLTTTQSAHVSYYAKWDIEPSYDYVQFQVSTDGGSSWIAQCGNYTNPGTALNGATQPEGEPVYDGSRFDWVLEDIDLSEYIGQEIRLRFQLVSDGGTRKDGFYFDDFKMIYDQNSGLIEEIVSLTIHPNPTTDKIRISFPTTVSAEELVLTDQLGREVLRWDIESIGDQLEVDLSSLPNGVYTLDLINSTNSRLQQKVVIFR